MRSLSNYAHLFPPTLPGWGCLWKLALHKSEFLQEIFGLREKKRYAPSKFMQDSERVRISSFWFFASPSALHLDLFMRDILILVLLVQAVAMADARKSNRPSRVK
jgi:hypothetical protein